MTRSPESSTKNGIDIRLKNIDIIPNSIYERGRQLKSLKVTREKLLSWASECANTEARYHADWVEATTHLKTVTDKIAELEADDGKVVIVSEHALLRYVERRLKLDLNELCKEILELPENERMKSGSTIVTVFPQTEKPNSLKKPPRSV